jgi:hypothetical protein
VATGYEADWPPGRKENVLPLPGIESLPHSKQLILEKSCRYDKKTSSETILLECPEENADTVKMDLSGIGLPGAECTN